MDDTKTELELEAIEELEDKFFLRNCSDTRRHASNSAADPVCDKLLGGVLGTWKMNPARSTFRGDPHPQAVTVRFERHEKGEVFTWDKTGGNGQAETFSMILYFDGKVRDFQTPGCPGEGTQSSRNLDKQTAEIRLTCKDGSSVRMVRRTQAEPHDLTLDITVLLPDGRRFERHLVLEK